eukprot:GHVT01030592.1.p1 GENE.GHVT01030592.1~~GHVT01030592.1.p1  ORF type:complete len:119 (+),score=20.35 GHVT01030592.1:48-404(+)
MKLGKAMIHLAFAAGIFISTWTTQVSAAAAQNSVEKLTRKIHNLTKARDENVKKHEALDLLTEQQVKEFKADKKSHTISYLDAQLNKLDKLAKLIDKLNKLIIDEQAKLDVRYKLVSS